jgi:hypothetical protein
MVQPPVAARRAGDSLHLDLAGIFLSLGQVIFHLQAKPHRRAAAKRLRKPYGHFGGDAGLLVHNIVQGLARNSQALRCFSYRQT